MSRSTAPALRAPRIRLTTLQRARCKVCGSDEVTSDEAHDRGLWLLGECGRCGDRWTAGPFDVPIPVPAMVRPVPPAPEGGAIVAA